MGRRIRFGWLTLGAVCAAFAQTADNQVLFGDLPKIEAAALHAQTLAEAVFLSAAVQYIAARNAWSGDRLGSALLNDFTAVWKLHARCDLTAGVRNAFDRRYEDPIFLTLDRLRGDGRTAFVRLSWRVWE